MLVIILYAKIGRMPFNMVWISTLLEPLFFL